MKTVQREAHGSPLGSSIEGNEGDLKKRKAIRSFFSLQLVGKNILITSLTLCVNILVCYF